MTRRHCRAGASIDCFVGRRGDPARQCARAFADAEVRPLVREMDEHAKIPRTLVDRLFELGVMGIEIPESYGGSGGTFFHAVLAVEELSRVDPSVGVLVDVQNTLVINAVLRWGSDDIKRRYLPRLASSVVGAYALSEAGSGSDAFALTTTARKDREGFVLNGRKLWITNGNEADLFIVFATIDSSGRLSRHHGVSRRARFRRIHRRQEGGQARHPGQQHLRADLRGLLRPRGEHPRRTGKRLQDGDRDPERGTHRHRRADDRVSPRVRCSTPSPTRKSANSSARRSPIFRRSSISLPVRPSTSRRPRWPSTTPHGCERRAGRF